MDRAPPPDPLPAPAAPPPVDDWVAARARALGLHRWPDVVRDLVAGRGFAAHARLRKIRRELSDGIERSVVDAALAESRLFAEPVRKAPGLGRLNGCGTGMYGDSERDPSDCSYVKTRFVSYVWMPIIPLDRWLVRDSEEGGWYFLARVPLDGGARVLRLCAVAGLLAAAAAIAAVVGWKLTHADLYLLNGLDVPAEVTIDDGPPHVVAPRGFVRIGVSSGVHAFRCVVKGRTVDDRREDVSGTADLAAYNVVGSASLCVEHLRYGNDAYREGAAPEDRVETLAGREYVERDDLDWVFEPAPPSVKLSSSQKSVIRRRADVDEGGWRAALARFAESRPGLDAAHFAEKLALAVPDDLDVVEAATALSSEQRSSDRHAKFLELLKAAQAELAAVERPR